MFKTSSPRSLVIGRFASDVPFQSVLVLRHDRDDDITDDDNIEVAGLTEAAVVAVPMNLDVGNWVLVSYDGSLFPGEVRGISGKEVKVAVMISSGSHYKWPSVEDCIPYPLEDVVMKLSPPVVKSARGTFAFAEKW